MKILILNSARKFIGEAAHSLDLTEQLVLAGHDAALVLKKGMVLERAQTRELPVAAVLGFENATGALRDFWALRRLVKSIKPDVVHCHRGNDHGLAAAVMLTLPRATRPALVRTRHRMVPVKNTMANRWLFTSMTDGVLAVSEKAAQSFGPLRPLITDKLTVIYSSVDQVNFHPDRRCSIWRESHGVAGDDLLVGLIARLQRVKGQDVFLRAAAQVAAVYPKAKFLIAGSGPPHKPLRIKALAGELGISDRVILLDWLKDVHTAAASLDVGVLASLGSEGSSRVTYEYMASGTAVVATTVGCLPELIDHEDTGYLVPPGDPDALAAAIIQCLSCDETRTKMRDRALVRIREHHTRSRWIADIVQRYQQAIATRRGDKITTP